MLASEIIDRVYDTWLYPAGVDRPGFDVLVAPLIADPSAKTISLSGRISNIPRDSILEIGSELILTESTSGSSVTANERGYLESDVAAHSVGDKALVNPRFTRKQIFDTLCHLVETLYSLGLYRRATAPLILPTTIGAPVALPTGTKRVIQIQQAAAGTGIYAQPMREGWDYDVLYVADPPLIQFRFLRNTAVNPMVTVALDFTVPTSEATSLDVPVELQPHLPMAVAGYLLQGKEVGRVQLDEIRRLLAAQGVQVGQNLSVGQALLNGFEVKYVLRSKKLLREKDPVRLAWRS